MHSLIRAGCFYPESYRKGDAISGLDAPQEEGIKVFHAGTRSNGDAVETSGGRVLCVCALGEDVGVAQQRAYAAVEKITWKDVYYRRDIGHRAVARLTDSRNA